MESSITKQSPDSSIFRSLRRSELFYPTNHASRIVPSLTTVELAAKNCVPCKGTKPMTREEAESTLRDTPGWKLVDVSIEKEFRFKSYSAGLDFAYAVGKIAEEQDHHPDILIKWRRVRLTLSTHVIKGLSQNDFIMAAKSELEYQKYSS